MINSRKISDLREDVAYNVNLWLAECRSQGLDVEISNTLRDNEYQAYLYEQGRTREGNIVTNAKYTTYHGAGLAIDFYSRSKGWSDMKFFRRCAKIAKKYGFSWAGDWKSFVEYCHIQWDNNRQSTNKNVPLMPKYKENEKMKEQKVSDFAKNAQVWVKDNGISDGERPQDPVTREEIWAMFYRFNGGK